MLPVVILAGGLAMRMRPFTETTPKALIPVHGRPFIDQQLELLRRRGVGRVVLALGYLGGQIEAHLNKNSHGLEILFSYDGDFPLGTGGAVKQAAGLAGDAFFVLYGDSYLLVDYEDAERAWQKSEKPALMTVYRNNNLWDKSNVRFEGGRIVKYSKADISRDMRYIDYGLGIIRADILENYDAPFDLAVVYSNLADRGMLAGYEAQNRFYEIGSREGLKELEAKLENQL